MRYSTKEVRGLIEGYAELQDVKEVCGYGLLVLIKLADLDRAVKAMPPKEYHVTLIHGLMRVPLREAGTALQVHHDTVSERYKAAVAWIVAYLNEGTE